MTTDTAAFIARLADNAPPVPRLRPPLQRTARYLAAAFCVLGLAVVTQGLRPDLAQEFMRPEVGMHWCAALLTGVMATVAAFHVSVPGRDERWALLPLPPLLLWLGGLGWGCLADWRRMGPDAMAIGVDWYCVAAILATSLPLGALLLRMVWHAGPVRPGATALTGALAVAALSAAALTLCHEPDTALMILIWDVGTVALVVAAGWAWQARLFAWVVPR